MEGVKPRRAKLCVRARAGVEFLLHGADSNDRDVLHAPGECPEVLFVTGRGTAKYRNLRIFPGPQDGPAGAPEEITVLDPPHPEAPLHAAMAMAMAMAQLPPWPQFAVSGKCPPPHCVLLPAYPDPKATFHEFYRLPSHASGWTARTSQPIPWPDTTATASWRTILETAG